jgi:hypothetical protein
MTTSFSWTTFDVTSRLPSRWQQDIDAAIRRGRVHADQVRRSIPWLYASYHGFFRDLAEKACKEPVLPAADDRYGVVLNVQRGTSMRFECHVDSNPLTGILFCTDHPAAAGGELVVGNDTSVMGIAAIETDCTVIRPHAGHLVFFDGSQHPHYARPLSTQSDVRIVAIMNYYTESRPESTRPPELNRHLFPQDANPVEDPADRASQRVCPSSAPDDAEQRQLTNTLR